MSMMGDLDLELQEQANELGFSTVQEAVDAGYLVDWTKRALVDGQTAAHEAWLTEKKYVLEYLDELKDLAIRSGWEEKHASLFSEIKEFIEEGEV